MYVTSTLNAMNIPANYSTTDHKITHWVSLTNFVIEQSAIMKAFITLQYQT